MSKAIEELRQKFQSVFGNDGDGIFPAVVTEVDESEFTCTVRRDEQVDFYDVRLRGLVDKNLQGFACIPKIKSTVIVCRIGKSNELFICKYTEIDKVVFTNNDLELTIDPDNIDIKKGEHITIHADAKTIQVTNDKTKLTHEGEALTLVSDQSTVKITTSGLTLNKGNSGLKKTLEDLIDAISQLTVTTAVGPSGIPINVATFKNIKADLKNYLEN